MNKILLGSLLLTSVFLSASLYAQKKDDKKENATSNFGIGFRLGDLTGLTFKKYFENKALEISFGRTYSWGRSNWYYNHFDEWYMEQNYNYKEFQYQGYKISTPYGLQVHYLIHKSIKDKEKNAIKGLNWYYGFGAQFRFQRYAYSYRYKLYGDPEWYYSSDESVTDIDLGADLLIGLEYRFEEIPVSLFTDVNLFMEIVDDPFQFWGQGGIGARFNF